MIRPGLVLGLLLGLPGSAAAVRPFITDDARTVGARQAQLETYLRGDSGSLEHWALVGFGPVQPVELTLGGMWGAPLEGQDRSLGAAGPILQVKLLFHEGGVRTFPGVAVIAGLSLPFGHGHHEPEALDEFAYLAVTYAALDADRLLFHANFGGFHSGATEKVKVTWGVGTQVHLLSKLYGIGEVFSGDPYAASAGGALQVGARWLFSEAIGVDATAGSGLWGEPRVPVWGTVGLRLVAPPLW